ncbi:hypothetical protein LTR36_010345 [Oleoguttula mirabilis]|uniref:Uncharacterized protein n=1 Tax=Oleoguttula mirabilis TaxID=1507867 RepID=A0AAV9J4D5_9PEZI|nr:hypothetical protein LTR36_010345 [Oleoguttula mirabilis]
MATTDLKSYDGGHVYVLDVNPRLEDDSDFDISSVHDQKNRIVEKLFRKHFDYEIHNVTFPPRSKPEAVLKYFEDELDGKDKNELIIIYFHGGGGENGEDYCWRFSHTPKREIDAYELIQTIIAQRVDCLLLLDCYIPDRFHDKWKPSRGNVEIIATGQAAQHSDGKLYGNDPGNFTTCLVSMLDTFVNHIDTEYKGHHAPKSIPNLLAMKPMRTKMSANPRRIWINKTKKTKKGNATVVERLVILPDKIRETGKVQFFSKQIQGPGTPGLLEEVEGGDGESHEDEGVGGMVEEGKNGDNGLFMTPEPEADDDLLK